MSLFGKIMTIIFIIWSLISVILMSTAGDISTFFNTSFGMVLIGYILIGAVTVILKAIVNML